ncbi:hypothetical protein CMI37_04765 [Candidatus Pacearchaeota archaeon]|nr:hypothetical protein [Candidatus Pacearchaeota archaeon]
MNETIEAYLAFLWQQFQYDWGWMSDPWMLYTLFPVCLYFVFFVCKWTVLLAPITVPIMVWRWPMPKQKNLSEQNNYINN